MAINPDVSKTIEAIDQRIAQLRQAKAALLEAFGPASNAASGDVTRKPQNGSGGGRPDRFGELVKFLTTHGPASRKQILAQSGIPQGTVSYLLSSYKNFQQLPDGRWGTEKQVEQLAAAASPKTGGG